MNATTPADLLLLAKYILQYHPNIFSITRLPEVLVQPLSSSETRLVTSFNPFVRRVDFLGGKTGTSDVAFQNSLAIFSFHNTQVIAITLGSRDRVGELEQLFQWVDKAYKF